MHLKKRRRRRRLLLLLALLLMGAVAWLKWQYLPTVRRLVTLEVDDETSDLVTESVDAVLSRENLTYEELIRLQTDETGCVTSLSADLPRANRLRAASLMELSRRIPTRTDRTIPVPLGNALLPVLFSGRGGAVRLRILSLRTSDAEFANSFTSAGINQTLHSVDLNVTVLARVLCPAGILELEITTRVPVAQTVIVGRVPQTVITFTGE